MSERGSVRLGNNCPSLALFPGLSEAADFIHLCKIVVRCSDGRSLRNRRQVRMVLRPLVCWADNPARRTKSHVLGTTIAPKQLNVDAKGWGQVPKSQR